MDINDWAEDKAIKIVEGYEKLLKRRKYLDKQGMSYLIKKILKLGYQYAIEQNKIN